MDVGIRLVKVRKEREMSQGDIEQRTGLLRSYQSRVECGHTLPQLDTLEKWVNALGLTLGEFFADEPSKIPPVPAYDRRLTEAVRQLDGRDKQLLLSIANTMAKQEVARNKH